MKYLEKAKTVISIEKLRLIESELFRLSSKYGIATIQDLDDLIIKGKLSEKAVGDDLFVFDFLISEKQRVGKDEGQYLSNSLQ